MKSYRKQFVECRENGTAEDKELKKPQVVKGAVPPKIYKFYKIIWCNKFNKQCQSNTCKEMREQYDTTTP